MKQEKFSATALLFPSLLMALIVLGYPVLELLNTSTHSVNKFFNVGDFVLFQNYLNLFQDEFFRAALVRTLWWTLGVVGGTVFLSFPIALILNEEFYGQALARTIILLPWAVSLTIMAVVWRWALNGESGLLNLTLQSLGITHDRIQWLAEASTSFPMSILIGVLVSIPFCVTVLLGGLSSLQKDVYEAARVDGATGLLMFRHITLPMMKPFISIAVVLNVIYVFNSFPILWVLTEGGPVNSTDVLVTYLYKATSAKFFGDPGKGAALGIIMLIMLLIFSLVYARVAKEGDEVRA
ncbi:carbohydrate ABC transporter permease [Deinococcus roseus]|uniref:ABC transporter permease n=1 Tax=Deinococcus roseus TaxID=392414 RepID=A0ABQ2DGY6_9DEIO|nr:sugar ABC transporter permease [Deinococcus roseus]GGJ54113.1 ABC transporter permease [Deinococcus roseus]